MKCISFNAQTFIHISTKWNNQIIYNKFFGVTQKEKAEKKIFIRLPPLKKKEQTRNGLEDKPNVSVR